MQVKLDTAAEQRVAERMALSQRRRDICRRLDAPYALMTYRDVLDRFEARTAKITQRTGHPLNFRSGNRRYTFWWHKPGKRLLVKVGWLGGRKSPRVRPVRLVVEDLAARMHGRGACRLCGAWVERNGTRRKFCSDAHAARYRKLTWRKRKQWARNAKDRAAQRAEGTRLLAHNDALQQEAKRAGRAEQRRRQRARKARRDALERIGDERERAFREAVEKD